MRSSFKVVFLKTKKEKKPTPSVKTELVATAALGAIQCLIGTFLCLHQQLAPLPLCDPNRQRDADRIAGIQDDFLVTDALLDFFSSSSKARHVVPFLFTKVS